MSSINKENGGAQDDKVTMPAKKSESTLHDEVIEVLPISIVIFLLHFFFFLFLFLIFICVLCYLKDAIVDSDSDSGGEMVDGILSSGPKSTYELPDQEELIRRAFAGDDVEEDFQKDKEETLNEENPEPEKPVSLPGWGQWTHIQKKKGLASWMVKEQENAKKKREEAIKKRKDAHLNHVIISEKLDKKVSLSFSFKLILKSNVTLTIGWYNNFCPSFL